MRGRKRLRDITYHSSRIHSEPTFVDIPQPDDPVIQISCEAHNNAAEQRLLETIASWAGPRRMMKRHVVNVRRTDAWLAAAVACGGHNILVDFYLKTPTIPMHS